MERIFFIGQRRKIDDVCCNGNTNQTMPVPKAQIPLNCPAKGDSIKLTGKAGQPE